MRKMPYKDITELPKNVKSSLSADQQKLWMSVFNDTHAKCAKEKQGNCDKHALRAAWAVVKRPDDSAEHPHTKPHELPENIINNLPDATPLQNLQNLTLEEYFDLQLIENRIVLFHGAVYESIAKAAAKRLEYLASISNEPIKVILNSVGGSVYDGLLVFDTIKSLTDKGIEVTTEARGLAASMGSIILQAGTKRLATPHTRFLIHEVSSWQWGETTKLEERTEEMRKLNDMLNGIYAERTGKSLEEINKLTKKTDYWMSAEEAKEFGLIDDISEEPATIMEGLKLPWKNNVAPIPIKLHLFCESFNLDGNEVTGVAIHPKKLWHPEEGQIHEYLREELTQSAKTSRVPVPFGEDHVRLLGKGNEANKLWYDKENDGIGFRGIVDKNVAAKIKRKQYKGVSIEINWFRKGVILEKMNGLAPRNFDITAIHFMKRFPPTDKDTYVKMWEGFSEGFVLPIVAPPFDVQIDQLRQMFEDRLTYLEGQVTAMGKNEAFMQSPAPAIIIFKESQAAIQAEITKIRSMLGDFDKLKEAINQKSLMDEKTFTSQAHILSEKIDEYNKGIVELNKRLKNYEPESDKVKDLRKKLYELNEELDVLKSTARKDEKDYKAKYNSLRNRIIAVLPPPHIWGAWRAGGAKIMIQRLLIELGIKAEDYYS